jgi:Papain family cysteine protease
LRFFLLLYFYGQSDDMKQIVLWGMVCLAALGAMAQPAVIDYTSHQSPVKNQGGRNTCSGFAVAACLETFAGVPADLSEQHIYAGLKMLEYPSTDPVDQGGRLNLYPQTLSRYGVLHESRMPYDPAQRAFSDTDHNLVQVMRESQSGPVSMLVHAGKVKVMVSAADCEVAEFDEGLSINNIKRLLRQGVKAIGIGYYVNEYWFDWEQKSKLVITPDSVGGFVDTARNITTFKALKNKYGDGVFAQINDFFNGKSDKTWYYSSNRQAQGHAVTIVGYNTDGFIIKNSWGSSWGNKGYAVVSYDYHKLFAKRMLAIKKIQFMQQPLQMLSPFTDLRLKLIPINGIKSGISVSLFCMDEGYDPDITKVEYAIYKLKGNGKILLDKRISLPGIVQYDHSFETVLLKDNSFFTMMDVPTPTLQIEVSITARGHAQPIKKLFRQVKWANSEYKGVAY